MGDDLYLHIVDKTRCHGFPVGEHPDLKRHQRLCFTTLRLQQQQQQQQQQENKREGIIIKTHMNGFYNIMFDEARNLKQG